MEALTNPKCDSCDTSFKSMKQLDVHMKKIHFESEDLRIKRLTKSVETVRQCEINSYNQNNLKFKDCSECGLIFTSKEDLKHHNKNIHKWRESYNMFDVDIIKLHDDLQGNLQSPVHKEEESSPKVQVFPQENWLSKSLPNLKELLATIPVHTLVSKEDELESKKEFDDIMCKFKDLKVQSAIDKKSTLNCTSFKFNTTTSESLKIHNENVHEPIILKCGQCPLLFPSENVLNTHKRLVHTQKPTIVIKMSLNLINGEAGGLSDIMSNPKRGQVPKPCKPNVNEKRGKMPNQPGSNYQGIKKKNILK